MPMTSRILRWIVGGVATGIALAASGAWAWGLEELRRVRVQVQADAQLDPVEVEIAVIERLRALGIVPDPEAETELRVEVAEDSDRVCVALQLVEPLCLQRDPLRCSPAVVWARSVVQPAEGETLPLIEGVLERFERAWVEANR